MKAQLRPGDVVLVAFPFTDLGATKLRPAIVVSSAAVLSSSPDVCLCFVSSVVPAVSQPYDVVLDEGDPDFAVSGLKHASVVRAHKLATLEQGLVRRRLGHVGAGLMERLRTALADALISSR